MRRPTTSRGWWPRSPSMNIPCDSSLPSPLYDCPMTGPMKERYAELRRVGDLDGATDALKRALADDPRADWAYDELVGLLFARGKRAEAEALARVALRVNPRNARAHDLFGSILSELNDLPAGEWHFRRALDLAGETAPLLASLALNLMQQGRTDEAETLFARADA